MVLFSIRLVEVSMLSLLSGSTGGKTRLDTSIRPICFGINKTVSTDAAKAVGAAKFKRYEHVLYTMAQLSRIVYCDSGIAWNVITKSLGMSNDIVNKVITAYDWKYGNTRRSPIGSQKGNGAGLPMESYSLSPPAKGECWGTYVSTKDDVTCLMLNVTQKYTPRLLGGNSIFTEGDAVISFKGSSTLANFKHDLMSQFTASDLQGLIAGTGIKVAGSDNKVTGAFVKPLMNAWSTLVKGLTKHITKDGTRLFLTGHSLGGAYTTLFGFILAEAKVSGTLPIMAKVSSIHIVSFGAPTLLSDTARNTFNRHLDSGLITLDRVVSQKIAARSAATQALVGGIGGPNDVIPTIPAGFTHPGYKPLATNIGPELGGRPYSIDNIRKFYGVDSKTRYRDPATWPFSEDIGLGDIKQRDKLASLVKGITQVTEVPADVTSMPTELTDVQLSQDQSGGALGTQKSIYEKATADRIPNFVSVQGSSYMYGFAHGEYLGMFFLGGFRLAGMKNPSNAAPAYFELCADGMKISYDGMAGGRRMSRSRQKQSRHKRNTFRRR